MEINTHEYFVLLKLKCNKNENNKSMEIYIDDESMQFNKLFDINEWYDNNNINEDNDFRILLNKLFDERNNEYYIL